MSDGSEVWLNSSSSLRFPLHFSDSVREVFLQGEAFFKVAKNAKHPFVVHSPGAAIHVLGTSFNVHAYHSRQAIVSLVEGSVKTSAKAHSVETTLKPGLEAVIDSAQQTRVRSFKQATTLSWMKGLYYFHDKPLAEIGEVLQRWFGLTMIFNDPSLSRLPVTGAIEKDQPLTDFLSSLQNHRRHQSGDPAKSIAFIEVACCRLFGEQSLASPKNLVYIILIRSPGFQIVGLSTNYH